jgi:glutathione S-transferase
MLKWVSSPALRVSNLNFHQNFPEPTFDILTGPIQSQANFFYRFLPQRHAFPTQRFVGATERVYGILNTRLADRDYVAGPGRGSYSIADIAIWPYAHYVALCGIDLERFPNVLAWWERINAREAVKSGMTVGGRAMPLGWEAASAMKKNPEVWEKMEAPLRDALQSAQKEFGYVYKSP